MRCRQHVRQAAEGMIERQRLLIKDIDGSARDLAVSQSLKEISLDHDRPARCIHKSGRWLHECQLRCAHKPARSGAEHQMDADEIRLSEEFVLRYKQSSRCRRALGGEVLAPGDDGHAEGFADLRHCASNVAEAEQSQCPTTEIIADEALPSTASQRCILVHEMTRTGQYSSLSALLDPSYHLEK